MTKSEIREHLLLKIIHLVATLYKNQVILKGGMLLRLMNSPRQTQDVDYVMTGKLSRKNMAEELALHLKKAGMTVDKIRLNSRGAFMDVSESGIRVQIEISVVKELQQSPEQITTSALAMHFKVPPQIITVMSRSESYSHKIAAALERKNLRDLYDLSLFEADTAFDEKTLQYRLSELAVSRSKPVAIDFKEAGQRLKKRIEDVAQDDFERELTGWLPEAYLKNLYPLVRSSVMRLVQRLLMAT